MGVDPDCACEPGTCVRIPTGGQLPARADAVVMLEYCEEYGDGTIGVARPVSVSVDTFGTGVMPDTALAEIVAKEFDLRPQGIIETFGLRRPIFTRTTNYGHFGKPDLPWEQTPAELTKALQEA